MVPKRFITSTLTIFLLGTSSAFIPSITFSRSTAELCVGSLAAAKGFSEPAPKKTKSAGADDRASKSAKYDEISKQGGQEYRIYVRQFGSDDSSWLPAGSIAVPRGAQVSDAIFANENGLKESIVRTFPKLKGMEVEFEFGYNLKIYPDDPIEPAVKSNRSDGPSFGNWVSNLLSPIDNTPPKN